MKQISLFAFIFAALIITSCGAKEEETQDKPLDNEIVDLESNTTDYPEFFADDVESNINPADSSSEETMILVDDTEEIQVDPPIKEETKVVKKEPVKDAVDAHQKRFYIVVGSFEEYGNAEKLNKYFKNKGYHPLILPKTNQYNRVAISSYVEEANARKAIKKLRIDHNDLTFWIFKW